MQNRVKISKNLFILALAVFFGSIVSAQTICNPAGDLMLYTNYDGGTLTINVDQNIPNIKIGVCSYEGCKIILTGAFVANVVAVRYAGYNGSNVHCGASINTSINGAPGSATTTIVVSPPVTLGNPNGNSSIICGYSCSNSTNQGGCNTVNQIEAYFLNYFAGSVLFAHKVQYGCWTGTQSVSIGGNCCPPAPVFPGTIASSQTICAGTVPAGLVTGSSATVSSGTILYYWQSSSTSTSTGFGNIPGATSATYAPGALFQTTYYRRAASTSTDNISYGNVLTVYVLPLPLLTIGGNSAVCVGGSTTLTATGGTSYAWSNGASGSTIVVSPTLSSIYSCTCFATNGCSVAVSSPVVVNPLPSFAVSTNTPGVCIGRTITLSALAPGGGVTYTWMPGNIVGNPITVSPTASIVYTATGQNVNSCLNTTTVSVSIYQLPAITVGASNPSVCIGKTTVLTGGGGVSYTWLPGPFTGPSVVLTPTASQVYTVTGNDGSCVNTATQAITVIPLPTVSLTSDKPKICTKETILLTAGGGISYNWLNPSITASNFSVIVSPTITTSYSVIVTAASGCDDMAVKTVTVSLCTGLTPSALKDQTPLSVYPNPNSGEFTISGEAPAMIEIINNAGQLVKTIHLNEKNNYRVSLTNLAEGIYFMVSQMNGQTTNQKIVVVK